MSARCLRAAALGALISVAGCVTSVPDPEGNPDAEKQWLSRWEFVREQLEVEGAPPSALLFSGDRLSVHGLRVQGRLGPPERPAAEVLIVVEGSGVLQLTGGRAEPVEPGTVALLPAGSRQGLVSRALPLRGVLVRSRGAAGEAQPRILHDVQVLPPALTEPRRGNHIEPLGSIPGAFTVRSLGISGVIERHLHAQHDELLFVLAGYGTLGLGTEGEVRNFISTPLRTRALIHIPAGSPHSYADEEGRTLAISIQGPDVSAKAPDVVFLKGK